MKASLSYLSIQDKEKTNAKEARVFVDSCLRFIIFCSDNLKRLLHSQLIANCQAPGNGNGIENGFGDPIPRTRLKPQGVKHKSTDPATSSSISVVEVSTND